MVLERVLVHAHSVHAVFGCHRFCLPLLLRRGKLLLATHLLIVLRELAACKISLIHLHRVHLYHLATAAVWRCASVTHASKGTLINHVHLHCHPLQVHLLDGVDLLAEHVVNAYLTLSSGLLRCHGQVVALVHCELVLALLEIHIGLGVGILNDFAHLHFAAHRGWTLGI